MKISKLLAVPFVALLLSGCMPSGGGEGGGGGGGEGDQTVKKDDYYDTSKYNLNKSKGAKLQLELHKLMLGTHHTLIKYSDYASYLKPTTDRQYSIDQVNKDTQKNLYLYTNKECSFSEKMTREHVWPCANSSGLWVRNGYTDVKYYIDSGKYVGGGSDLYHIRPSTSSVNTARGNSRFKEYTAEEKASGTLLEKGDGGPGKLLCDAEEYSKFCEPPDVCKGDIARIIMYVYVHYSRMGSKNDGWEDYLGSLALSNVIYAKDDKAIGELLTRWNNLDPVCETEKLRNDTIQAIQGNRNPFVDYPFLLDKCFQS